MSQERLIKVSSGWTMLGWTLAVFALSIGLFVWFISDAVQAEHLRRLPNFYLLLGSLLIFGLGVFMCSGFFTLQPNEARVLILFWAPCARAAGTGPIR